MEKLTGKLYNIIPSNANDDYNNSKKKKKKKEKKIAILLK